MVRIEAKTKTYLCFPIGFSMFLNKLNLNLQISQEIRSPPRILTKKLCFLSKNTFFTEYINYLSNK